MKRGGWVGRCEMSHTTPCYTHGAFFVGIDASVCKKQLHNGNAAIKSSPIERIKALTSRMGGMSSSRFRGKAQLLSGSAGAHIAIPRKNIHTRRL